MSQSPSARRSGGFFPALCNVIGTLILLAVILSYLPLALPQLLGYSCYSVVSGSMEPEIPVGSVVYVEPAEPEDIHAGDVIAYWSDGTVVTHRVVENRFVVGEFITKGDANEKEDIDPTPYNALIGRMKLHIPVVGQFMMLLASNVGKIYLLCFAACGVMFNILAGRIRERQREKFQRELDSYVEKQAVEAAEEKRRSKK